MPAARIRCRPLLLLLTPSPPFGLLLPPPLLFSSCLLLRHGAIPSCSRRFCCWCFAHSLLALLVLLVCSSCSGCSGSHRRSKPPVAIARCRRGSGPGWVCSAAAVCGLPKGQARGQVLQLLAELVKLLQGPRSQQ